MGKKLMNFFLFMKINLVEKYLYLEREEFRIYLVNIGIDSAI